MKHLGGRQQANRFEGGQQSKGPMMYWAPSLAIFVAAACLGKMAAAAGNWPWPDDSGIRIRMRWDPESEPQRAAKLVTDMYINCLAGLSRVSRVTGFLNLKAKHGQHSPDYHLPSSLFFPFQHRIRGHHTFRAHLLQGTHS